MTVALADRVDELERRVELLMEHLFPDPPAARRNGKPIEDAIHALERAVERERGGHRFDR